MGPIPNTIDELTAWAQSKCDDALAVWNDYVKQSNMADDTYWYAFHEQGYPCMGFYISEENWYEYNSGDPTFRPQPFHLNLKDGSVAQYSSFMFSP